jgi:hypothetical protein
LFSYCYLAYQKNVRQITYKGFGWYGYLADDEINEESIKKIKELGGNSVNINVYYEYSLENESFILLSNLTKIKEKIKLAHKNGLKVFLSPFANLVGGHYTGGTITKPENFLNGAKNISLELAKFAQENNVDVYAVWNELGLAIHKLPDSINLTNKWLQDVREDVRRVYNGTLTTKEGVQLGLYESYNFSGYDCIGLTFYPLTTSFAKDPHTNFTYAGVESLEEYEIVVKDELKRIEKLKERFNINCVILGEIGIDVVGGKFVGNDEESEKIRAEAYEIVLRNGIGKIDGFFFNKFEGLNEIFRKHFLSSLQIPINNCSVLNQEGVTYILTSNIIDSNLQICMDIQANNIVLDCNNFLIDGINSAGSLGININGSNVTVKNCNVRNWERGIWTSLGTRNNKIMNNTISFLNTTKESHAGIGAFGEFLLIENNTIFNTSLVPLLHNKKMGRGIWGHINHSIIRRNLIYNINGHGISLSSNLPPYSIINNTIEENVVKDIPYLGHTVGIRCAEGVAFSIIRKNIIANVPFGISLDKGDIPGNAPLFMEVYNNYIEKARIGIYVDSGGIPLLMNIRLFNNTFISTTTHTLIESTALNVSSS